MIGLYLPRSLFFIFGQIFAIVDDFSKLLSDDERVIFFSMDLSPPKIGKVRTK